METSVKSNHLAHLPAFADNPIVFLTVCTYGRRKLLDCDVAHELLHGLWSRSGEMNGWFVGDYLIMPDHLHLFVRAACESDKMSDWIKMWKSVSSRRLMRELNIDSPVWQEDYFDRYLRSSDSYRDKWLYVEQNPVRAGLVSDVGDWVYRGRVYDLAF